MKSIDRLLDLAEQYESILESKRDALKSGDTKELYSIIKSQEFPALKSYLKEMKTVVQHRHLVLRTIHDITLHLPSLRKASKRRFLRKVLGDFNRIYPLLFSVYNSLRHQMNALRNKDLEEYKRLFSAQIKELREIGTFEINEEGAVGLMHASRLTKDYSKSQFSRLIPVGFMRIILLVGLLQVVAFGQGINKKYLADGLNAVMTEKNLTPGPSSYDVYFKVYGGAGIEITDLKKDKVPDDISIRLEPDSLKEYRQADDSYFDLNMKDSTIIILEISPTERKGWKKIGFGEKLPTGHPMFNRKREPRWIRILDKKESVEVCQRINKWIFSR